MSSDPERSTADNSDAPAVVDELLSGAVAANASDIHLQMRGAVAEVSFRLDGVLSHIRTLCEGLAERVFGRIKFLSKLRTYQETLPQDGRIDAALIRIAQDVRVSTYPTVTGEKIVLRLYGAGVARPLPECGFPPDALDELEQFLARTSGLLLLTGPAGSGKTTTIYACLRTLSARRDRHIITVEDPAEQVVPGIMQTEINEAAGLGFATAARHLLRQDPQVLVIGEIRDDETAQLVVRAALTGHLVISTLHAGSCAGVFERLLVLCRDFTAVASSLELVLNQRLIRRLCPACHAQGCPACIQTGYRGRLPLVEFVRVSPQLRPALAARDFARLHPSVTLRDRASQLVLHGLTTELEVERVLGKGPA